MNESSRGRLVAYGVAVLATGLSVLLRLALFGFVGNRAPYITFFPAIILSAYMGGVRPGLLATLLSAVAADFILIEPRFTLVIRDPAEAYALGLFVLIGVALSGLGESRLRFQRRVAANEQRYAVTLASIGDAVIATDTQALVTYLNPAAEALTGWPLADAVGRPLAEVFRIVNEQTEQPVEDPAAKVLRLGTVVGLANHTALLACDGRKTPIDDCGAPIIDERGAIAGVVLVFRDVCQRRRAEKAEAVRRTNERMELAVRGSNVGIWELDMPDGDFRHGRGYYVNFWEQLGFAPSSSPTDVESGMASVHPEDRDLLETAIRRYLTGETNAFEIENRVRHKDGSDRWMLTRGVAVRDAEGKPNRFVGIAVDITDRKRAEEALAQERHLLVASEKRFRTFVDHAADGFFLQEQETARVLDVNRRACESLGYTRDELIGMTPLDFDADVTPALIEGRIRKLFSGEMIAFESRHRRKDGTVFPVEIRGKAFWEGSRGFIVSLVRDMTERKWAEQAVRESEERFRTLAESLPHMVWTCEPDGTPDYLNARHTEFTGLTLDQLRGRDWRLNLHPEDGARVHEMFSRSIVTGARFEAEYRVRRADGAFRWQLGKVLALRDDSGRITKWFGSSMDIDDQKRAQEALREAKEAAESANHAKDEFLANVSHEIRTPMNAIIGMTDLVLDTPLTEDQRRCLKAVKSGADNLLGIINDLLDFSKIEAGKMELAPADFSLRGAIGETLRALAVRVHKKGLELISHVEPDVPDALVGDTDRLRQVLLNLVGNAVKFTEEGEVVVRVEVAADPAPEGEVALSFTVSDTGIGISQDKQERIFRAFEQEDTSTTRKYGGTGLGLTIAARLAALMGGKITVQSEPGQGSIFAFTARFKRQSHPPQAATVLQPPQICNLPVLIVDDNAANCHILEEWLRGWQVEPTKDEKGRATPSDSSFIPYPSSLPLQVLLAEDNELSAQVLEQLLVRQGHRVRLATNGREALALAEDGGFDLLLLDVHMPELDGFQVARAIRERELRKEVGSRTKDEKEMPTASDSSLILHPSSLHLPIIALTARSRKEDRDRCLAAGMDDFLTKPVRPVDLWEAIDRVLKTNSSSKSPRLELFDAPVLLAACGCDPNLLKKMCQTFAQRVPEHLVTLQDALRDQDAVRLRETAHRCCGLLSEFSTIAGDLAGKLEDLAASAQLDKAPQMVELLETTARELLEQVGALSIESLQSREGG
jgi:PAS domain S-box-containing protein